MKINIVLVIMSILTAGLVMGCIDESSYTQPSKTTTYENTVYIPPSQTNYADGQNIRVGINQNVRCGDGCNIDTGYGCEIVCGDGCNIDCGDNCIIMCGSGCNIRHGERCTITHGGSCNIKLAYPD